MTGNVCLLPFDDNKKLISELLISPQSAVSEPWVLCFSETVPSISIK